METKLFTKEKFSEVLKSFSFDETKVDFLYDVYETVIDGIRQEIIYQSYVVKPIHYQTKIDGNSGKVRQIGIQDVKQQLYDYIATYGLWDLFVAKIGYYQ